MPRCFVRSSLLSSGDSNNCRSIASMPPKQLRYRDVPEIVIPRVVEEATTRTVLTLERAEIDLRADRALGADPRAERQHHGESRPSHRKAPFHLASNV